MREARPISRRFLMPAVAAASAALLASAPGPATADDAAFLACRALEADAERLACYDAAARAAAIAETTVGAKPVATTPPPERSDVVATPAAASDTPTPSSRVVPESLFGLEAGETNAVLRNASGVTDLDALESRVSGVRRTAEGKLVVTLANGQVWSQSDTASLSVTAGNVVRIRRASLGSFLMARESGRRSIRVRRIQ